MRFQNKVVITTGAAQGIGKAIAEGFAREGAISVIADIQQELAETTAADIRAKGGRATAIRIDVTNYQEANDGVRQVLDQFGKVDVLINNAGWSKLQNFLENTEELWNKVIAINFKGQTIMCHAVLNSMIKQKYGRIVNIASVVGRTGNVLEAVYASAKGGVISQTKSLALAYAKYNILINCVCPGAIETPMLAQAKIDNPALPGMVSRVPLHRFGRPEEIATAVLFLASDDASYITGQSLGVDGGLCMY